MTKRILDVVGALCGLAFVAPFTPFIALAIARESGRPIFVGLARVSEGRLVRVWKFRTMIKGASTMKTSLSHLNERNDGPFFKIKDDPRLTKIGRLLRMLRVDEFPQFWNVLKGELTLIGPRPHEPEEVAAYPPEFKHLANAKAGLTGLSQVMGASALPFLAELEYDATYLKNASLGLDLKILWKTVVIFLTDPTGV
ncbi:MAG: sugar transferase [Candidatus Brennerbacteria bacterium]|nr:sugar transferase [Candidatus Brennerbacteria bacterium]